ncbi:response regulator [Planctomycetes bacterium CA13]
MAKVLLVEDSSTQALQLRIVLEEDSHQVQHVTNGRLALDALENDTIDVVVTDLEMPEVNGLELVETMLMDFPHIPAILVTARGSEDLASQALQQGAVSYVPKRHVETLLNDTITNVLGVARTDASFNKLISMLKRNSLVFELSNDADLISPLVGLVTQVASDMNLLSGTEMLRLRGAVEHALVNAMYRGNLELSASETPAHHGLVYEDATTDMIEKRKTESPYRDRTVNVEATVGEKEIRIVVRDCGNGFDTSTILDSAATDALDSESGRGLVLMKSFADELIFNDTGNEVTLVKCCR